jgi:ABC-type lipoprotein release transport system permease subunit
VAFGLLAALALNRVITSSLFGIEPSDPPTLLGVSALLCAVALAASYIPALRASRLDPQVALREE